MEETIRRQEIEKAGETLTRVIDNVETVIIGKRKTVELVLCALLSRGHVLLEDVPGVGKTSLISAVAASVGCEFRRIQFTPDLMPSDITGFSIYNPQTCEFEFRPGAVMSHLILADEINRSSAKTQASLLEAMEEKQVTVDSRTYPLAEPFMVMATQNPLESFGTYPLPEAQIDRFMVKLSMGYPTLAEEQRIVHEGKKARETLHAVITREEVIALCDLAQRVDVHPDLEKYLVAITAATRTHEKIVLGASPRGSIALCAMARSLSLIRGRSYVTPDDIKDLAVPVLAHRITLTHAARSARVQPDTLIEEIVSSIAVPV